MSVGALRKILVCLATSYYQKLRLTYNYFGLGRYIDTYLTILCYISIIFLK